MSGTAFDAAYRRLLGVEGEWSDHPSDAGGKTRWGITEAVARDHGYSGDMRDLPLWMATRITRAQYWDLLRLDAVADLAGFAVAYELFDTAYNMGAGVAWRFLQRALNSLNRQQRDYADVTQDGLVGPRTLSALNAYMALRGETGARVLRRCLDSQQGTRYLESAEARPANEDFVFGWFRTRVGETA